jgi:hypothetical protein
MKTRGLIALAIAAVGVAVVLFVDFRHDRRHGAVYRDARAQLLPQFDRKAVQSITIRRRDNAPFTLRHAPSSTEAAAAPAWQVAIAGSPPADDAAIEDLLSALDLAESNRVAELSPAKAGLQPPAVEVAIDAPAGPLMVQLGTPDVTGRGVYARAGGDGPIRVVSRRLLELADRDASAFRDRRLFPVDPAAVTSIVWKDAHDEGALQFVDGRWRNGRQEWVDDGRVREALRRLFSVRIERFEPDGDGSAEPTRMLTVMTGPDVFALEGSRDGVFARGNDRVRVPNDAFEAAWRALAAAEARDLRLISMPPDVVRSIDLSEGSRRVSMRRVNGAWTFTEPQVPYAADTRVVDDWLARLATITTATTEGGPHTRRLVVEGRFRQETAVSSPPDVYALLEPDPLRFRERALLSFAHFDVRRLQRTAGKDVQVVTSDDGGTWRVPSGAQADAANVGRVVGALSDLRAEEFLDAAPRGEPSVRLDVDIQQPGDAKATRHVLQIHPGCGARLDAHTFFRIERAACDALGLTLLQPG